MPSVSVIIATYDRSNVLRLTIESVLASSFTDWEMIIVGDACTDDTASVVRAFDDSRIRFVNLARNHGEQSVPNNHGVALARRTLHRRSWRREEAVIAEPERTAVILLATRRWICRIPDEHCRECSPVQRSERPLVGSQTRCGRDRSEDRNGHPHDLSSAHESFMHVKVGPSQ